MQDNQHRPPPQIEEFLKPEVARGQPNEHTRMAWASIDRYSDTWRVIEGWAKAEREELRTQLETPGLSLVETEAVRGRIAALADLLDIGKPDRYSRSQ